MSTFHIGDVVIGNNSWLNGMLGYGDHPGTIIHAGEHSSIIHLFILNEDITLMNEYIDKIDLNDSKNNIKVGDLVELKTKIRDILTIKGVGIVVKKTVINTNDFDGKWKDDKIHAFLVYFPEEECEYTIPISCLKLFSI